MGEGLIFHEKIILGRTLFKKWGKWVITVFNWIALAILNFLFGSLIRSDVIGLVMAFYSFQSALQISVKLF